jgi:anaphase-promoting complex subunit 1
MSDFLDHYRRDLGTKWLENIEAYDDIGASYNPSSRDRQIVTAFSRPPCFLEWIESKIKRIKNHDANLTTSLYDLHDSAEIPPVFRFTRALHRAFSALYGNEATASDQSQRDRDIVQILIEEGMKSPDELRDELPAGVALPLLEVLYRCRGDPQICSMFSWSSDAWSLLGRTDMIKQREHRHAQLSHGKSSRVFSAYASRFKDLLADTDKDGIQPLEVTSSMLFPGDNRIHEVGKLLRSSRPIYLQVPRAVEVTDHDYERLKQDRLLVLCRRTFAVTLGRGMLTFGNLQPVPAETLPVPALCLSGRVPPTNNTFALDVSSCPGDMSVWPEFHNGVAAGLRLPYDGNGDEGSVSQITRTWIVYNRPNNEVRPPQNPASSESTDNPPPINHAHGGLLMALGLRGHLSILMMSDIYEYLTQGVVTTTVGILIGMAANKRGSCDPSVSKMLCLHIPSLLPASFTAMDVAGPAQAAAVASIGLLYQGSSHRLMTEFLLEEIGKRPSNDSIAIDREGYALSCGIALGMVNLAKGSMSSGVFNGSGWNGLADLDLGERLHRFVVGGIDDTEQRRRQEAIDRVTNSFGMPNSDNERSSRIFEGDTINTDITAPGATLALGLMYMRSG